MSETVAAIVVTYNRKHLLVECLDALLNQTRRVDKIIIINNASTDGTSTLLDERGYLANKAIEYVQLQENTGGAGGFNEGVKRGFEAGYDWLWVMDDDAEPASNALELMTPGFRRIGVVGVANLKIGLDGKIQYSHSGWTDICRTDLRSGKTIREKHIVSSKTVEIENASFVGLAISKHAVKKIGLPRQEFFIHQDDTEFCLRLKAAGKIVLVPQSQILHKDARKEAVSRSRSNKVGRNSERIPIDKLWLSYYGLRNLLWLRRHNCPACVTVSFMARNYARRLVGIFLYDDHKFTRMRFFFLAFWDGWHGIFDNRKPKRICVRSSRKGYARE